MDRIPRDPTSRRRPISAQDVTPADELAVAAVHVAALRVTVTTPCIMRPTTLTFPPIVSSCCEASAPAIRSGPDWRPGAAAPRRFADSPPSTKIRVGGLW